MDDRLASDVGHVDRPNSHRRIVSSVALLGGATVLVKLVALAKDLLVARQLGAGDALDAYLVALVLPSYAAIVLTNAFASAFLPVYVRLWRSDGLPAAQRLAGGVLGTALGLLTLVTLLLLATAAWLLPLVGSGFEAEKMDLTRSLFYPMAGIVLASGVSAYFAAVLNAHERFLATAVAPLAVPLGTLAVFWLGVDDYGVMALAVGTAIGFVGEATVLTIAARFAGLLPRPRWQPREVNRSRVGAQYVPLLCGGLLMSSAMLIDQAMAASLGSGQVSVLNYGGKLVAVVLGIVAASLSNVLFPRFTHLIAAGRLAEFRKTFAFYATSIVLLSIPAVALLELMGEPLVRVLFQRGAFTTEAAAEVSRVQAWLLPQIPFYILALLGGRVLSALDGNAVLLRIAALNVVVNVTGNLLLMRVFGVDGIAMATSLMYVVATATTLWAIRLKLAARGG